jgi:D-sedoheptulose 7-phosphate isomerase
MVELSEKVKHSFAASIEFKLEQAEVLSDKIAEASNLLVNSLLHEGKIFICGNGGSAANCLHFSTAMIHNFMRPPLPVIPLVTDIALLTAATFNDSNPHQVFARQIQALASSKDILIILSTSGNTKDILHALHSAHDKGMNIIALLGNEGGWIADNLNQDDIEIRVMTENIMRIREIHLFILHAFCELVEIALFG